MSENMEHPEMEDGMEEDVIVFEGEDGEEYSFQVEDYFFYQGEEYAVLSEITEEEDEDNIRWFLEEETDFEPAPIPARPGFDPGGIPGTVRLWPHHVRGEGHFLALMKKKGEPAAASASASSAEAGAVMLPAAGVRGAENRRGKSRRRGTEVSRGRKAAVSGTDEFRDWIPFGADPGWENRYCRRDAERYILPEGLGVRPGIRYLRTGLLLGEVKNGRCQPSQALACALDPEADVPSLHLDPEDPRILRYLRGETLELAAEDGGTPDGYVRICMGRFPLGWAIRSGNRCKNKYASGWRMNG